MREILTIMFSLLALTGFTQTKPGTSFSGTISKDPEVCAASAANFISEKQVDDMITEILAKVGARNRYIIVNCTQVENCQAFLFKGKPYILYNPNFLGQVKKLSFSSASLPGATDKDWETLTILAHELGHHVNNHLLNPLPNATQIEMELEADETAGFIIYLLGGSLPQVQLAFKGLPVTNSYTHPARQQRVDAVIKGWNSARQKYPPPVPIGGNKLVTPGTNNDGNSMTDNDGNIYQTVKLGKQVWLQSNLNVSRFNNGDIIPEAKTPEEWQNAGKNKQPAWCYFKNDPVNGRKCGKIYNWYAANDPRGLGSQGWHIPSTMEWLDLDEYMQSQADIKALLYFKNPNGFNGWPACGTRNKWDGDFIDSMPYSFSSWWSSTEYDNVDGWSWNLIASQAALTLANRKEGKTNGFYIRLVRD